MKKQRRRQRKRNPKKNIYIFFKHTKKEKQRSKSKQECEVRSASKGAPSSIVFEEGAAGGGVLLAKCSRQTFHLAKQ